MKSSCSCPFLKKSGSSTNGTWASWQCFWTRNGRGSTMTRTRTRIMRMTRTRIDVHSAFLGKAGQLGRGEGREYEGKGREIQGEDRSRDWENLKGIRREGEGWRERKGGKSGVRRGERSEPRLSHLSYQISLSHPLSDSSMWGERLL